MASEIESRHFGLATPFEFAPQSESFLDRLTLDAGLRYQVRDALGTFNIEPAKDLGLGYTQRPFYTEKLFDCLGIDASSYIAPQIDQFARTFMQGCLELRSDFNGFRKNQCLNDGLPQPRLNTLMHLPTELQHLAAFKVIDRADPTQWLAVDGWRQKLEAYFVDRLNVPPAAVAGLLGAASIIEAPAIIADSLTWPKTEDKQGYSIETVAINPMLLTGPTGPEHGIHLGLDLMSGTSGALGHVFRKINDMPEYLVDKEFHNPGNSHSWEKALKDFWPEIDRITESALGLTDKPADEYPIWKSYLFANAVYERVFKGRRAEGFDGSLDQLVSWIEPVPDKDFPHDLQRAETWIRAMQTRDNLDIRGADLARQAFAKKVIEGVEREIILGGQNDRTGRLNSIATLIDKMTSSSPGLSEQLTNHSPALRPFLKRAAQRAADPWGYRFHG